MQGIMLAFEDSKMQKITVFAEFLREAFREKYKIEF